MDERKKQIINEIRQLKLFPEIDIYYFSTRELDDLEIILKHNKERLEKEELTIQSLIKNGYQLKYYPYRFESFFYVLCDDDRFQFVLNKMKESYPKAEIYKNDFSWMPVYIFDLSYICISIIQITQETWNHLANINKNLKP